VKPIHWIVITVVALLVAATTVQTVRLRFAQTQAWVADTTARNERARHDTTRHNLVAVQGEMVSLSDRLSEQADVNATLAKDTSRLARALRQERQGHATALAMVQLLGDSLHRITQGLATAPTDTTIRAAGTFDTTGVHVGVIVTVQGAKALRPPPLAAVWEWDYVRRPISLGVEYECQGKDASVAIAGPEWAVFNISQSVQDPQFCNPKPTFQLFSLQPPSLPWSAALIAVGGVLGYWIGNSK